ncbi:MAG: hypothetical protein WCH34_12500 [Bacteroidota bacterium]
MVILILIAFIAISISVDALIQFNKKRYSKAAAFSEVSSHNINVSSVSIPLGIYFDKSHTWVFMEKNGDVKIGLGDFLRHIIGPMNIIKIKQAGEKIQKGEPVFTIIQNGKQLSFNAPISGTVVLQNHQIFNDSTDENSSQFQDVWVYTVRPSNWLKESQFLLAAANYKEWLKNEFMRLKDFLMHIQQKNNADVMPVLIQDGGELQDHVLENFGSEVWEEFQIKFINVVK